MRRHIIVNLGLVVATVTLCSVVYPFVLLFIDQVIWTRQANGSLVTALNHDGTPRVAGSRLIAQAFAGDAYFHPRPSAVSYDAAASGASNWAPSNTLLRERVAQQLGPIVKYRSKPGKAGTLIGPDLANWLHENPQVIAELSTTSPGADERWLKSNETHRTLVAAWKKSHGDTSEPTPNDVIPYFTGVVRKPPVEWPSEVTPKLYAVFFESWRQAHPDEDLEPVPADMVMASASGLDPHITLENAIYQIDRVAATWAKALAIDEVLVRAALEDLVHSQTQMPLDGLAGAPLVNVLETNKKLSLELRQKFPERR
jgi:K+-transporting ATPase ATPase C chain